MDTAADPRRRPSAATLVASGAVLVAIAVVVGWAAFVRDLPDLDAAADTTAAS